MQTCCICVLEVKNIKTFIRKLPPSFVGGRVSPRAKTLPFMEFGKHNEHESSDDISSPSTCRKFQPRFFPGEKIDKLVGGFNPFEKY